ncbi:GerAB/ArcD/ProY family transporter [Halanaerobacter jeridensis]|uniref:Spore germination protein n=1 Tax=Halanaerobacter jeridensis TaxID=706427 RepID=A0A938XQH1_9FIRM|nr:endospore germination permease [Halanaerobacter jeridensis]MBM7557547.1 spore germination protein [Halanaerobacter jeridensis]
MKNKKSDREMIANRQLVFIIIQITVGTGILSLPRQISLVSRQDSWIAVLLGGSYWVFSLFFIYKLGSQFPQQTIIEYSEIILGSILGKILSLTYVLYSITITALSVRIFIMVITTYILPKTPVSINLSIIIITCLYLISKGLKTMARLDEFLFFVLAPAYLVMIPTILKSNWWHFKPILGTGIKEIFDGSLITTYSFLGPEIILLIFPYIKEKKNIFKSSLISLGIITLTYLYVIIITIGYFGVETLQYILWPTINLLKAIKIPFFGRLEFFLIFLWIAIAFTSIAAFYYMASYSVAQFFSLKNKLLSAFILLPIIYYLFFIPKNIIEVFEYTEIVAQFGTILIFVIPPLLLLITKLRGLGHESQANNS